MVPIRIVGLFAVASEQGTGHGVRHVVVAARGVVDAVTAPARGAALQLDQLGDQPLVAQQPDLARVDQAAES